MRVPKPGSDIVQKGIVGDADRKVLKSVIASAKTIFYDDDLDYFRRIILVVMAISTEKMKLRPCEIDTLAAICKMVLGGLDAGDNEEAHRVMIRLGMSTNTKNTFIGYKSALSKKGWIKTVRGKITISEYLMRAINSGGFCIAVVRKNFAEINKSDYWPLAD